MSAKKQQSSYSKLFSNTLVFAIGSFSSKILVLLLIPIYTNYLTRGEMGKTDVLTQIANWTIPLATVSISEAIIRFGLDKAYDKKKIFTLGNLACAAGMACFAVVLGLVQLTGIASKYIGAHGLLLFAYVVMSGTKTLYTTFVRSMEKVKLFAAAGIVATMCTLLFTGLFYMVLPVDVFGAGSGVKKYLLATILADLLTTVYVTLRSKLWKYIDFRDIDKELLATMLQYSVPLIPAQLLWLITNSSDSFMTTHYLGEDRNGVLSAAYRIPNIVATVYMMFGQAWNMSAITENDSDNRDKFYENVFDFNQSLLYILAGGCMLVIQPVTNIMIGANFRECVRYSPLLVYSTIFSCFTTFMGSIYLASKMTKRSLMTSLVSGVINVGLNVILIPTIGLYGPPISTVVSYMTVFIIRAYDSKKLVPFKMNMKKMIISNAVLLGMLAILLTHPDLSKHMALYLVLYVLFCAVFLFNFGSLESILFKFLPNSIAQRIGKLTNIQLAALMGAFAVFVGINYLLKLIPLLVILAVGVLFGAFKEKGIVYMVCSGLLAAVIWYIFGLTGAAASLGAMSLIGMIAFMQYRYIVTLVISADAFLCGLYFPLVGLFALLIEIVLFTLVFIKKIYAFVMYFADGNSNEMLDKIKESVKLEGEEDQ